MNADDNGGEESYMNGGEEYEDDDDEVDFNLGNGDSSHGQETSSYNNGAAHMSHKGPNAKEDG